MHTFINRINNIFYWTLLRILQVLLTLNCHFFQLISQNIYLINFQELPNQYLSLEHHLWCYTYHVLSHQHFLHAHIFLSICLSLLSLTFSLPYCHHRISLLDCMPIYSWYHYVPIGIMSLLYAHHLSMCFWILLLFLFGEVWLDLFPSLIFSFQVI